jgi:hypothetical protein
MEPGIEELRKNYEKFDDRKLIRIASEEASGLRPEALELVKTIIKERGLSEQIIKAIDVQTGKITEAQLLEYAELLRKLPCPICNGAFEKLNATLTATVISFVVMTNYSKKVKIGCPECLDKQNNNAMIKSALLGWWGFPWGLVRTPQALILNNKRKKLNHLDGPNDLFKSFVLGRVGRIEANRKNPSELEYIINYIR